MQLEELQEDCIFQPSQDKEFNTPACAYNLSSSEPSNGVCLCSVYKDGVSFACCFACTKQYGFVLVFVTIQPHIARRWPYINIACVEHIETDELH